MHESDVHRKENDQANGIGYEDDFSNERYLISGMQAIAILPLKVGARVLCTNNTDKSPQNGIADMIAAL